MTEYVNVCNKYNIQSDRIYWNNFTLCLDVRKNDINK